MAWISIAIIIMTLWAVSLWIVLCLSCIPIRPAFLSNGSGKSGRRRNVLLVVAHPDDESMFFAPTILFLTSEGHNIHILCLSMGNADGKGIVRLEEFYKACIILKVPVEQVKILDNPNLQDGFEKQWDHQLLATIIKEEVENGVIDSVPARRSLRVARGPVLTRIKLITFDNFGVSGHPNHRDVHHGICMLLRENARENIEAWELVSDNILRKYSGPVDIWLSILSTWSYRRGQIYCVLNKYPHKTYFAMAAHGSQWIWFRKLFVLFSSYTYMNTLRKIKV